MVKVGLITAGLVSAVLNGSLRDPWLQVFHCLFFWKRSTMNTVTLIIRSHAFWPTKLITDPAVLKMKPIIEPIRPGRIAAILLPRVLKPFPIPLATNFRPLLKALTIFPIVVPTASTTAETVKPYFLNMFLTLWRSDNLVSSSSLLFSRASICCVSSAPFFSCSLSCYSIFILIISYLLVFSNWLLQFLNIFILLSN